jgi:hypothetical protein
MGNVTGLTITAIYPDEDYLAIELHASSDRFAGSTWIYAGTDELSEFAAKIEGFPRTFEDHRAYEFGTRDRSLAGGFCSVMLRCLDRGGHVAVDVILEDDPHRYSPAQAHFTFQTEAAAIDVFTERLREVERERRGSACLCGAR